MYFTFGCVLNDLREIKMFVLFCLAKASGVFYWQGTGFQLFETLLTAIRVSNWVNLAHGISKSDRFGSCSLINDVGCFRTNQLYSMILVS